MTLKQKIDYFIKEATRFIELHGLHNYCVYFEEETENLDCRANCEMPDSNRQLTIGYSTSWLKKENDLTEISKVAYHEVLELLFSKLREMASNRLIIVQVDDEIHKLIRLMENLYFDKLSKVKKEK
jgi:hypothetical protein